MSDQRKSIQIALRKLADLAHERTRPTSRTLAYFMRSCWDQDPMPPPTPVNHTKVPLIVTLALHRRKGLPSEAWTRQLLETYDDRIGRWIASIPFVQLSEDEELELIKWLPPHLSCNIIAEQLMSPRALQRVFDLDLIDIGTVELDDGFFDCQNMETAKVALDYPPFKNVCLDVKGPIDIDWLWRNDRVLIWWGKSLASNRARRGQHLETLLKMIPKYLQLPAADSALTAFYCLDLELGRSLIRRTFGVA